MKFLQGTYGVDLLSIVLLIIGSLLGNWYYTSIFGYILIFLSIFRALSKDIFSRKRELIKFTTLINRLLGRFGKSLPHQLPILNLNNIFFLFDKVKYYFSQKNQFKITKCPKCGQKLRLPRGKGKIIVTCKNCSTKFDLKT
ncbi:Zn-finger containing protein [Clostridium carnis]